MQNDAKKKWLKKALEITLYVAGAGAFGVFLRWLQVMIAFNDLGLVDRSAFNVLLPAFVIAAAVVFYRFLEQDKKSLRSVPTDFAGAFRNDYRVFSIACWVAGAILAVGSLLLLGKADTDKYGSLLRVLAILGVLSGLSAPLLLELAHREEERALLLCLVSLPPIALFAAWIVYLYRANSINSVLWSYVPKMFTAAVAMFAFARIAGFVYGAPKPDRARFDAMLGGSLCLMCLADERYMGMQLMLLGTALLLMLYNWAMICNLQVHEEKTEKPTAPTDGFERLDTKWKQSE